MLLLSSCAQCPAAWLAVCLQAHYPAHGGIRELAIHISGGGPRSLQQLLAAGKSGGNSRYCSQQPCRHERVLMR